MSQQTLRNVPPIVFVQDKKYAAVMEVRLWHNCLFTVSTSVCVRLYALFPSCFPCFKYRF